MNSLVKILFLCLLVNISFTQPSITWQRYYISPVPPLHENFGEDITSADNGNFYIIGSNNQPAKAYIIKINAYGDTTWTRLIDSTIALTGVMSEDSGCVFTGRYNNLERNVYTIKLSKDNNIVWYKKYGITSAISQKIIRTSSGDYLICGSNNNNKYAQITLINVNGTLKWERSYLAIDRKIFWSVTEAFESGFIAVGLETDDPFDMGNGVVIKLDTLGNIIWQKRYDINGTKILTINSISKINNSYIIGGNIYYQSIDKNFACIAKIDTAGNLLSYKILGDSVNHYYMNEVNYFNGKYITTVEKNIYNTYDIHTRVFILDNLFNIAKEKTYEDAGIVSLSGILPLSNGDIMFSGSSTHSVPDFENAFVVRADSNLYSTPIGINTTNTKLPDEFILFQNYPNPFNPSTKIKMDIPPSMGVRGMINVKLVIYDILGREATTLVNEQLSPGTYEIEFNGTNFSSGIYFFTLTSSGIVVDTKKMVLIK